MTKIDALAKFLEITPEELKEGYDENNFIHGNREYLVLTDAEADQMAADYIRESLWAFNKSFLNDYGNVISEIDEKTWASVVEKCESANGAVKAMVGEDNLAELIDAAISADGRGHFLNTYDNEEYEQGEFYIYRTN